MTAIARLSRPWRYAAAIASVALTTGLLILIQSSLLQSSVFMLYLFTVLLCAILLGLGPALLAALLASVAVFYFFVPPLYALVIATPQDVLALAIFTIVAVIGSSLAGAARRQTEAAQRRAAELAVLYRLSQTISAEVDLERILPIVVGSVEQLVDRARCQILLYDSEGRVTHRAGVAIDGAAAVELPVRAGGRSLGVLRVARAQPEQPLSEAEHEQLRAIASQLALVVERARLAAEAGHTQALAESDQLKSALLMAISHDLRTPLAVIKGAASDLLSADVRWDAETTREFYTTIDVETDHLNRLVGNLLDMARIEAGALQEAHSWHDIGELIASTVERMQPRLAGRRVALDVPLDLPLVHIHYAQIEQVLVNLLENAAKHTPAGSAIAVSVTEAGRWLLVAVQDDGPGVPAEVAPRLFERFVRAAGPEQRAEGVGLGLAVCKGLVEAHGGRIWAESPARGARFVFSLPLGAAAAAAGE